MKLSELIAAYGDDKVEFQKLDDCAINLNYTIKKGTTITFRTSEPIDFNGTKKIGIIIWLDRVEMNKILGATK